MNKNLFLIIISAKFLQSPKKYENEIKEKDSLTIPLSFLSNFKKLVHCLCHAISLFLMLLYANCTLHFHRIRIKLIKHKWTISKNWSLCCAWSREKKLEKEKKNNSLEVLRMVAWIVGYLSVEAKLGSFLCCENYNGMILPTCV